MKKSYLSAAIEVAENKENYAITPNGDNVKIIVDVEAQKLFKPRYSLVTRGIFYDARMHSAQLGTEFIAYDVDKNQNEEVMMSQIRTVEILKKQGFMVGLAEWDMSDGKSLDDLLVRGKKNV